MVNEDYIVGLTDGEGCFYVNIRSKKTPKRKQSPVELHFYLKLREDSLPLLKKIKAKFGCGAIYYQKERRRNHRACYRFEINSQNDIQEVLVPFFSKYHLQGPKKKDFALFKKIARMMEKKLHLRDEGLEKIRQWKAKMNR